MFSRPKILFLVSLLFVALLNPKFNPYLLFKFLIFYHSSIYGILLETIVRAHDQIPLHVQHIQQHTRFYTQSCDVKITRFA